MAAAQLLLVEDDNAMREMLESLFRQEGYVVSEAASAHAALELARKTEFDVVLSDIKMPGKSGLELVGELRELLPDTPVVLMTAFGSIDTAVDAMRAGAFGYTTKPFQPEEVIRTVKRAIDRRAVEDANRTLRGRGVGFKELVGESAAMRQVFSVIRRAAHVDTSVLITGEIGTGKEVVARTLHHHGRRSQKPFVAVDCSAPIPDGLLAGAHGGTLFLCDVADLDTAAQSELLNLLRDPVDVRIVSATQRSLESEVEAGRFRDDLFYRLNVIPVHLPPLRERPEDVPHLVEAFVRKYSGGRARRFSRDAINLLKAQAWRGNARELENVIERTLALSDADLLSVSDLPADSLAKGGARTPSELLGNRLVQALGEAARNGITLRALEDLYIEQMLAVTGGRKGEAARLLGIDRKTLYRRDPTH